MTIIGFQFSKISCEKHSAPKGKITVNRNAKPTGVEEVKLGTGQRALRYTFTFDVEYKPKIAEMSFAGNLTELVDDEKADQVLKAWDEKKALPPKTLENVMNGILNRCHVQALVLSKEFNIPPPFNMPKVRVKEASESEK